jgi:hypothetical protein
MVYTLGYFATKQDPARAYGAAVRIVRRRGWMLIERLTFPQLMCAKDNSFDKL